MEAFPPEFLKRLRKTLLRCGPFGSKEEWLS
jgi:hypothetical protein